MKESVDASKENAVLSGLSQPPMVLPSGRIRRRWSAEEKYRYVSEANQPGMTVSLVARKYGIPPKRLYNWRKCMQEGSIVAAKSGEEVVPKSEYKKLQAELKRAQKMIGEMTMEKEILKEVITYARKKKWISYKPLKGVEGFQ